MARYSSFKYSDQKYGASTITETGVITWIVNIDWDDDRVFDGSSEGDRLVRTSLKRGRERYLAASGDGFDKMRPGSATLILDNKDRRYDPRNASSPLYPNVSPGKQIYIRVRDNANNKTETIFRGLIDDIIPIVEPGGGQVQIECKDFLQILNDTLLSTESVRIMTTITDAMRGLLYDARFPAPQLLDNDTQPVIAFGVTDKNAGQVVFDLAEAALGTFFVNNRGRACFYSRNHSGFTTHTLDQSQIGSEIKRSQPWDGIFNTIKVISHTMIKQNPSVIYYLPNPIAVASGQSYTIYPKYPPSINIQVSELVGNTQSNGEGDNINLSITSARLNQGGGYITILAGGNGYITKLEIRGEIFDEVQEEFSDTKDADIAKHGLKQFILDTPYLQDRNYAKEFVNILGDKNNFLYSNRDALAIRIFNRPDLQYKIDLLDKVALTVSALDIDDTFYVLGIEHKNRGANMQDIETVLYLDKIIQDDTAITPAPLESEPIPLAPPGHKKPGEDPKTKPPDSKYVIPCFLFCMASKQAQWIQKESWDYSIKEWIVWNYKFFDPYNMLSVPSTDIIIPQSGIYAVWGVGKTWAWFPNTANVEWYHTGYIWYFRNDELDRLNLDQYLAVPGHIHYIDNRPIGEVVNPAAYMINTQVAEFRAGDRLRVQFISSYAKEAYSYGFTVRLTLFKLSELI